MSGTSFTGRRAVVTGASGGIGSCIVRELTAEGVSVGLIARRTGPLEKVRDDVAGNPGATIVAPADVTDRTAMQNALQVIRDTWGGIDIAIASAGTYTRGPALESDPSDHEDQWRTSYLGTLYFFTEVIPGMLEQGWGRLGLVSSADVLKGMPRESAYASGKAAEAVMAGVIRQELHGTNVYVSIVYPSRTDTSMIADLQVPLVSHKIPPENVARVLIRGMRRKKPRRIAPPFGPRLLLGAETVSVRLADMATRWLRLSGWKTGEEEG